MRCKVKITLKNNTKQFSSLDLAAPYPQETEAHTTSLDEVDETQVLSFFQSLS